MKTAEHIMVKAITYRDIPWKCMIGIYILLIKSMLISVESRDFKSSHNQSENTMTFLLLTLNIQLLVNN